MTLKYDDKLDDDGLMLHFLKIRFIDNGLLIIAERRRLSLGLIRARNYNHFDGIPWFALARSWYRSLH